MSNFPKSTLYVIVGNVLVGWATKAVVGTAKDANDTPQTIADSMVKDAPNLVGAVYAIDLPTSQLVGVAFGDGYAPWHDGDISKVPPEDRPNFNTDIGRQPAGKVYATDVGSILASLGLDPTEVGFGDDDGTRNDEEADDENHRGGYANDDLADALGDETAKGETPLDTGGNDDDRSRFYPLSD